VTELGRLRTVGAATIFQKPGKRSWDLSRAASAVLPNQSVETCFGDGPPPVLSSGSRGPQRAAGYRAETGSRFVVVLSARPNQLSIDLRRTALIVVDMQNAFASKGGMFDLAGFDISDAARVIEVNRAILGAARRAGVKSFTSR